MTSFTESANNRKLVILSTAREPQRQRARCGLQVPPRADEQTDSIKLIGRRANGPRRHGGAPGTKNRCIAAGSRGSRRSR